MGDGAVAVAAGASRGEVSFAQIARDLDGSHGPDAAEHLQVREDAKSQGRGDRGICRNNVVSGKGHLGESEASTSSQGDLCPLLRSPSSSPSILV